MEIYLVGGAVRDQLLGLPVQERDWVVVGSTPEEMLRLKYRPVGKDFPVFLHPVTQEEYALARTERKTAKGYKGFSFYTDPTVTLVEDLARRDLSINAIAQDSEGQLFDPYHGQEDLKHKILRHVSPAFAEDPVRILRAARFAARLPEFTIHPETVQLMKNMVAAGEVNALVAERVWQECARALNEKQPQRFFATLKQVGAFKILFSELKSFSILDEINLAEPNSIITWAILLHTLKAEDIQSIARRLRIPREYTELALLVNKHLATFEELHTEKAAKLLQLIMKTDALRRPARFQHFLQVCSLIQPTIKNDLEDLNKALQIVKELKFDELQRQGLHGLDFANALQQHRLNALASVFRY